MNQLVHDHVVAMSSRDGYSRSVKIKQSALDRLNALSGGAFLVAAVALIVAALVAAQWFPYSTPNADQQKFTSASFPGVTDTGAALNALVLEYADFYALMPGNNSVPLPAGAAVQFPLTAIDTGYVASHLTSSLVSLNKTGTYWIEFTVNVIETGQLALRLNGVQLPSTVFGRNSNSSSITGMSIIATSVANSTLEVVNPASATHSLTITPSAGGLEPVTAHLIIIRMQSL